MDGSERVEWFLDESAEELAAADTLRFVNVSQLIVHTPANYSPIACTPEVGLHNLFSVMENCFGKNCLFIILHFQPGRLVAPLETFGLKKERK